MRTDWPNLIRRIPRGLTFRQAANMLLLPYATTRRQLLAHGYRVLDGRKSRWLFKPAQSKVDWAKVRWIDGNYAATARAIWREQGVRVSREYVRRMRLRFRKAK